MQKLDANGLTEKEFLKRYCPADFPRPSLTADIVVFANSKAQDEGFQLPTDEALREAPSATLDEAFGKVSGATSGEAFGETLGKATGEATSEKLREEHEEHKELRVLLIRRGRHPYIGQWALPGGFVNPDETVEEAAQRELEEETGIRASCLRQLYAFSKPGRDPRAWVITVAYLAFVNSDCLSVTAGDDAAEAQWFTLNASTASDGCIRLVLTHKDLRLAACVKPVANSEEFQTIENDGLAFDHAEIIARALQTLCKT